MGKLVRGNLMVSYYNVYDRNNAFLPLTSSRNHFDKQIRRRHVEAQGGRK